MRKEMYEGKGDEKENVRAKGDEEGNVRRKGQRSRKCEKKLLTICALYNI